MVLAPYIVALYWLFASYESLLTLRTFVLRFPKLTPQPRSYNVIISKSAKCYLALNEITATSYLLCYTVVVSGYITLSFLWPFSCLPESIRPGRRNSSIIASHPAVRLPLTLRQRQHQRKSIYLHAGLNTLTSVLPVTAILVLMFKHNGQPWWVFAIATSVDLALASAVVSLVTRWENPRDGSMSMRALERFEPQPGAPSSLQNSVCKDCAERGMRGSGLNWFPTPHL